MGVTFPLDAFQPLERLPTQAASFPRAATLPCNMQEPSVLQPYAGSWPLVRNGGDSRGRSEGPDDGETRQQRKQGNSPARHAEQQAVESTGKRNPTHPRGRRRNGRTASAGITQAPADLPRRTPRRKGEKENPGPFAFKQNAGSPVKTDWRPGAPMAHRRQDRRCFPTTPRGPATAINQPQR